MENEIWKDIKGYEGLYQVSNLGRVKSLDRIVSNNGGFMCRNGKLLYQGTVKGYKKVSLCKNSIMKHYLVHRLVIQAFIPNPQNYPYVNHKDENKQNNCVDNLEWCDRSYNNNYGSRNERASITLTNRSDLSVPIKQYTLEGKFIKEWPSIMEASRKTNTSPSSIYMCCINKYMQSNGYLWHYSSDYPTNNDIEPYIKPKPHKSIITNQFTIDGVFVKSWPSAKDAAISLGLTHTNICKCCRGQLKSCGGYIWKYDNKEKAA